MLKFNTVKEKLSNGFFKVTLRCIDVASPSTPAGRGIGFDSLSLVMPHVQFNSIP